MATKEKLLLLLEQNKGLYCSGEALAQSLQVTRAAICKAVKALRQDGYQIDAVTNKGYCLSLMSDVLSEQGIQGYLQDSADFWKLHVLPVAASTNAMVRQAANEGEPEGYTLIANEQTAGRGRYGRSFYSPKDTGVYLSILLRPRNTAPALAAKMTTMAAVAMVEAIERVAGRKAEIKWVNDILMDGKKVCGILTEGSFSMENGMLDHAVLGIGFNVCPPQNGFPEELQDIAGSVFEATGEERKNKLVAEFLERFFHYYQSEDNIYTEKYRQYSMMIGKHVIIQSEEAEREAVVDGIDEQCRLQVRYLNGEEKLLSYGEIKLK